MPEHAREEHASCQDRQKKWPLASDQASRAQVQVWAERPLCVAWARSEENVALSRNSGATMTYVIID